MSWLTTSFMSLIWASVTLRGVLMDEWVRDVFMSEVAAMGSESSVSISSMFCETMAKLSEETISESKTV